MRHFSSYGPIDTALHYYAPREELIRRTTTRLMGENPMRGGHFITVWAPRQTGKSWLFKKAPRRSDLRIYEAVFHFNLYAYLDEFLRRRKGRVIPEFPTGNGKIDLIIYYRDKTYGLELKSFRDRASYKEALDRAARYGKKLRLSEIYLVTFVEMIDEETRKTYETDFYDEQTRVTVKPIIIPTGLQEYK